MAREDVGEKARPVRRQMGDDDKGHAGIGGNGLEKILQSAQAARRGADADDRERRASLHVKSLIDCAAPGCSADDKLTNKSYSMRFKGVLDATRIDSSYRGPAAKCKRKAEAVQAA